MKLIVYTSLVGNRSELKPPAVISEKAEYWAFTNQRDVPKPWQRIEAPRGTGHNGRDSRIAKIMAHAHVPADYSIYHDASMSLAMDPWHVVNTYLRQADIAIHAHPCRRCVYDEVDVLIRESIGVREEVEKQVAHLRAENMPEGYGLWACGIIVRHHTSKVAAFERAWWKAFADGCERDQVSMPYAKWKTGITVYPIHGNVYSSPIARYHGHRRQS